MRLDGRTENRVAMAVPICLATAGMVRDAERVITVNLSRHGARVRTTRRWDPDEHVRLSSRSGKLLTNAKVVYCEPDPDRDFCVGLKFESPLAEFQEYPNSTSQYPRPYFQPITSWAAVGRM